MEKGEEVTINKDKNGPSKEGSNQKDFKGGSTEVDETKKKDVEGGSMVQSKGPKKRRKRGKTRKRNKTNTSQPRPGFS